MQCTSRDYRLPNIELYRIGFACVGCCLVIALAIWKNRIKNRHFDFDGGRSLCFVCPALRNALEDISFLREMKNKDIIVPSIDWGLVSDIVPIISASFVDFTTICTCILFFSSFVGSQQQHLCCCYCHSFRFRPAAWEVSVRGA